MKLTYVLPAALVLSQAAFADPIDPATDFGVFGALANSHSCYERDDSGRIYVYYEGMPSKSILEWEWKSDHGLKANVPMPRELYAALHPESGDIGLKACRSGLHHAALTTKDFG